MRLNRKQRRNKQFRRPNADQSPSQQMKAFLKAPGKFHIVELPGEKSFVVKVTDDEMPIFGTMISQLNAVLGFCEAVPATPVDAHVATTQEIAEQTGAASLRARERAARRARAAATPSESGTKPEPPQVKQRGGRHAKPETTFDLLAGAADVDPDGRRFAALEIAAAQDRVNRVSDQLEAANQRLRDAYERGGELHNRHVLDKFAEQASQQIAEQAGHTENVGLTPHKPRWHLDTDLDTARHAAINDALRQAGTDAADT